MTGSGNYRTANILLTGSNKIKVQSGDVVGYYRQSRARYRLRYIQADGYEQIEFDGSPNSVDLSNADRHINQRQALIQFTIGKLSMYSVIFVLRLPSVVSTS